MPTQPAEPSPPAGVSDSRAKAVDAAERGYSHMSIAWSLVAISGQLDGIRRDLQAAKRGR